MFFNMHFTWVSGKYQLFNDIDDDDQFVMKLAKCSAILSNFRFFKFLDQLANMQSTPFDDDSEWCRL